MSSWPYWLQVAVWATAWGVVGLAVRPLIHRPKGRE